MPDVLAEATQLYISGDIGRAKDLYVEALKNDPQNSKAWYYLGLMCYQLRSYDVALQALERAVTQRSDYVIALELMGTIYRDIGNLDKAIETLRKAATVAPSNSTTWACLGHVLALKGDLDQSANVYRHLVTLAPSSFWPCFNLAEVLLRLGDHPNAELAARRAIEINPAHPNAWVTLARALTFQGRFDEAAQCVKNILENALSDDAAIFAAAEMLVGWKAYEQAAACYRRVLAAHPTHALAASRLLDIQLSLCRWDDYEHFVSSLTDALRDCMERQAPVTVDVFNLHALPVPPRLTFDVAKYKTAMLSQQVAERRAELHAEPQIERVVHGGKQRIRLAYLLPHDHRASMTTVLRNIVENHDRDRFEVIGYSLRHRDQSKSSSDFSKAFDEFSYMPDFPAEAAARRICNDNIDLLVDTMGHTNVNGLDIMAYRPARVSAHYLGYSLTSGSDFVDYLITDRRFIPPEWRAFCSEKLVYLPDSFMAPLCEPISDKVYTRGDQGLPDEGFVFGNFNHPCKFEPSIFSIWMRILNSVPGSVMWLCEWVHGQSKNLRREAELRGVSGERLVFASVEDHGDHLSRLRLADLMLDCRYHGGGVTTMDALWAGVPVLSVAGDRPSARLGVSLLTAAGVPELVASNLVEYEKRAITYARWRESLIPLRARLAKSKESALFDAEMYQHHLEHAYALMWQNFLSGQPPQMIEVPAGDGGSTVKPEVFGGPKAFLA